MPPLPPRGEGGLERDVLSLAAPSSQPLTEQPAVLSVTISVQPRSLASTLVSLALHGALLALILSVSARNRVAQTAEQRQAATERPVQLYFAPPKPVATPRAPAAELPPMAPLTAGPEATPGTSAKTNPEPEPEPNAPPNATREDATRPNPGDAPVESGAEATAALPTATEAAATREAEMASEAQRIFGRPSARLGTTSGGRESRPWETAEESQGRGCSLPPEDSTDTSAPKGMGVVQGRIYREDSGEPLGGARLQILGTPYGAFSDPNGYYKLFFDRNLVDRCRTQMVRVSAPGYRGRDVVLFLGDRPNGDVPLSRY